MCRRTCRSLLDTLVLPPIIHPLVRLPDYQFHSRLYRSCQAFSGGNACSCPSPLSSLAIFNATNLRTSTNKTQAAQNSHNSPLFTTQDRQNKRNRLCISHHTRTGPTSRFYVRPDRESQVFRYVQPTPRSAGRSDEKFTQPSVWVMTSFHLLVSRSSTLGRDATISSIWLCV